MTALPRRANADDLDLGAARIVRELNANFF